jgi:hypothetical protein
VACLALAWQTLAASAPRWHEQASSLPAAASAFAQRAQDRHHRRALHSQGNDRCWPREWRIAACARTCLQSHWQTSASPRPPAVPRHPWSLPALRPNEPHRRAQALSQPKRGRLRGMQAVSTRAALWPRPDQRDGRAGSARDACPGACSWRRRVTPSPPAPQLCCAYSKAARSPEDEQRRSVSPPIGNVSCRPYRLPEASGAWPCVCSDAPTQPLRRDVGGLDGPQLVLVGKDSRPGLS